MTIEQIAELKDGVDVFAELDQFIFELGDEAYDEIEAFLKANPNKLMRAEYENVLAELKEQTAKSKATTNEILNVVKIITDDYKEAV